MTPAQNRPLYLSLLAKMRPGDIICCQGDPGDVVGGIIQRVSKSLITHEMTVRQATHQGKDAIATQCTMLGGEPNGAQSEPIEGILTSQYPTGRAWLLTLAAPIRARIDWFKFYEAIGAAEDRVKYDWVGLVLYALHLRANPNPKAMFCDEYCIWLMQQCGALAPESEGGLNPREQTPQALANLTLFDGCFQIWGTPMNIPWGKYSEVS